MWLVPFVLFWMLAFSLSDNVEDRKVILVLMSLLLTNRFIFIS